MRIVSLQFFHAIAAVYLFLAVDCLAEEFSGLVTTMTEDHLDGISATESLILETKGQRFLLRGIETNKFELIGHAVILEGTESDSILNVSKIKEIAPLTNHETLQSESGLRLLIAVFDIADQRAEDITPTQLRQVLIDDPTRSVKKLLETNSYGAVSVSDVTVGNRSTLPISLPTPGASCYPWYSSTLLPSVASAFSSQGIDSTSFDRVLMILPSRVGDICNFAGLAISSRETFYSGSINPLLALHELGHNVWPTTGHGFAHASSDPNNDGVIDGVYGDNFDAMSVSGYWYNFGHSEKEAWWISAGGSTRTLSSSGAYTINLPSAEFQPHDVSYPQRIRVDIPSDPRPYFITFRKMVGNVDHYYFDSFVDNRINIHRPAVAPAYNTLWLSEVIEGNSYTLTSPRLLIEFLDQASNVTRVRVTIGPVDSDNDGLDNLVDTDDDNDGILDGDDCSPTNPARWTTRAYLDNDNDGFATNINLYDAHVCVGNAPNTGYTLIAPPPLDNCYNVANANQLDSDRDGIGDACDSTPYPPLTTTPSPIPTATAPIGPTSIPGVGTPLPTVPPGVTAPALSLVSTTVRAGTLTTVFFGVGSTVAPTLSCFRRPPHQSSYAKKNLVKKVSLIGLRQVGSCKISVLPSGDQSILLKACEGTLCSSKEITVKKKH